MKCYQAKAGELAKHWYVIDATDAVVPEDDADDAGELADDIDDDVSQQRGGGQ